MSSMQSPIRSSFLWRSLFRRKFTHPWAGCAGGINIRDTITQLAPNQLVGASNIVLDEQGGAAKRLGCDNKGTIGVGGDRIISTYSFYRGSANPPQLIAQTTAGKLYYTTDPTLSVIVWTQIATGLSSTARFSFETFNGKCYFSNGVDSYASWDGTTYTTFGSAPKGRYLRLWKDTMWMSGVTALDDRVYSSAAGDAETWPIANWVDIAKGNGDVHRALHTDGLTLIVWKRLGTYSILDPVTFGNRLIDFEKGCESHFSVVYKDGNIYFLSRSGICRYLGDAPSQIISSNLDPIFDPTVLNISALDTAWAYSHQNRVGWALPEVGSSVPSMQVEYYPRLDSKPWMIHRMPMTCFSLFRSGTKERLYGGHASANKCLEGFAPIGTDDGATYQSFMQIAWNSFGVPDLVKYLRRLRVTGRGKFNMQVRKDLNSVTQRTFSLDYSSGTDLWSTGDTWGTGNWGPSPVVQEKPLYPDMYARWVSVVVLDAESSTGARPIDVGAQNYSVTAGEWALLGLVYEGSIMGVRD